MAEKAPHFDHDRDSGVVSEQPPISPNSSPNGSPVQREESPSMQRQNSQQPAASFNQVSEGVLVFKEASVSERYSDIVRDDNEENAVVPVLETQGPPSALFTVGPSSLAQEESGGGEQSASVLLLQEAQKLMGKETREQKAKLSSTEAKLRQTETQLQNTKDQLAEANEKTIEVERSLCEMTKKKDEVQKKLAETEQKLAEVEAKRKEELQQYNSEVSRYKEQLALLEQKNDTQRTEYEEKIEKLTVEMHQKEKSYDKHVLELTKETCDLKLQVAHMKIEEHSLKQQIAELQRDILAKSFSDYKSSSESKIQKLERLLSEASINSNSSQDSEKVSFKFSEN